MLALKLHPYFKLVNQKLRQSLAAFDIMKGKRKLRNQPNERALAEFYAAWRTLRWIIEPLLRRWPAGCEIAEESLRVVVKLEDYEMKFHMYSGLQFVRSQILTDLERYLEATFYKSRLKIFTSIDNRVI